MFLPDYFWIKAISIIFFSLLGFIAVVGFLGYLIWDTVKMARSRKK
jgi:flagellar biogenesis protein FliO